MKKKLLGALGLGAIMAAGGLQVGSELSNNQSTNVVVEKSQNTKTQSQQGKLASSRSIENVLGMNFDPFFPYSAGPSGNPMFFPKWQKRKGYQKSAGTTSSYRRKKCVKGGRKNV